MSYQITLNTWSGADKAEAAKKLAKIFRFGYEKSMTIVDHLCQGQAWRFEKSIPDDQVDLASTFLRGLGFAVDIQPIEGEVEPLPESTAISAEENIDAPLSEDRSSHRLMFQGDGRTFFNLLILNLIKTIFTLGIYRYWAKTNVRQYLWSQTLFAGDRFSYHGIAKELIKGALLFWSVFLPLIAVNVYAFFKFGPDESNLVSNLISLLFAIAVPFLLVRAWKYRLSRTAWRNIRFSFRGKGKDAFFLYVIQGFLFVITLGLYGPYYYMKTENFWRENSWFGDIQIHFSGVGKDFFKKYILAIILFPLTLGFYQFWYIADLKRYTWSHTHVGGSTFHFPITGKEFMKLKVGNFFILLLTLGFGYAWVVVRNQKFFTENLALAGNIELNKIVQQMIDSGAFGEEALDAIDIPIEIG